MGPEGGGLDSEEREELFFISEKALDGFGIESLPAPAENSQGSLCLPEVSGIAYPVKGGLDGFPPTRAHVGEDIPRLMHPAALKGDSWVDEGQRGEKPLAAVCYDELNSLSREPRR